MGCRILFDKLILGFYVCSTYDTNWLESSFSACDACFQEFDFSWGMKPHPSPEEWHVCSFSLGYVVKIWNSIACARALTHTHARTHEFKSVISWRLVCRDLSGMQCGGSHEFFYVHAKQSVCVQVRISGSCNNMSSSRVALINLFAGIMVFPRLKEYYFKCHKWCWLHDCFVYFNFLHGWTYVIC